MNFPPAPLSTSAGVSTVFPLWSRMVMGINNVFRSTRPNVTECISRLGETDIDPVLLFKNPSRQRLPKTFLFGGFHSFIFWCIFSLCVLGEVVLLMVFCHVSCLLADEAFSIFHQPVSFFNT